MFKVIHIHSETENTVINVRYANGSTWFLIYEDGWLWVDAKDYIPAKDGVIE